MLPSRLELLIIVFCLQDYGSAINFAVRKEVKMRPMKWKHQTTPKIKKSSPSNARLNNLKEGLKEFPS